MTNLAGSSNVQASIVLASTLLALSSLTVMANASIAPSLPGLSDAFAGTPGITTLTGLVMTLPSLSVVLSAFAVGALVDRIDRRALLLVGLMLYALGGASGAVATGMPALLAGRAVLGLGVAIVMTVTTAMIADKFQGPSRQRFMGWQGAAMSGGGVIFLLAGGLLAEHHWRTPFLLYLLAAPIALAALLAFGPAPAPVGQSLAKAPAAPLSGIAVVAFLAAFAMIAFYIVPTKLPFRLRDLGVDAASVAGASIAGMTAAGIPVALSFARLRARLSSNALFALSFALMAAGYVTIAFATNAFTVTAGAMLAGLGAGAIMPNLSSTAMAAVPPEARGKAAGVLTMAIFGGQFLSPLVSSPLAAKLGLSATFHVFAIALLLIAGALGVAILTAGRRRAPQ